MKKIALIVLVSFSTICLNAQNTVIGKWKIAKMSFPEVGVIKIDMDDIKKRLYIDKAEEKKGQTLTVADSINVETMATDLYNQFSTTRIEYRANKTYTGNFGGIITNGTFIYNAAKKLLTTKPKSKPSKTTNVSFENDLLVFEIKEENMVLYFERVK